MYLKVTLNDTNTKVVQVEVSPDRPIKSSHSFPYEVTDETTLNKILNNYDILQAVVSGANVLSLQLFDSAKPDPEARRKSSWLTRVRPALMRATQTAGQFNL